tara:strand:+ start:189 stop:590 length:402 start_codon:yes stop_codon:yes gene_type:complete
MIDIEILKIASNTENFGILDNHTHSSKLKNPICGDEIKIYLIVKNNKILKFKYECQSCIYCQASVSLLSRKVKNRSVEKVKNFLQSSSNFFEKNKNDFDNEWKEFDKIIMNKNIARKECLLLPLKTTLKALNS